MNRDEIQDREWEALYKALCSTLAVFGREDAFGEGDYWVVDDNYGTPQHKVCVHRTSFLTSPMAMAVQRLLRGHALRWEILFSLDGDDSRRNADDLGITVREHEIIEHWNRERMRGTYGSDFQWGIQAIEG